MITIGNPVTQPDLDTRPTIAAAVIVKDGRVMLVRRRVDEGNLSWQFPAGEVERGESASDTAVREAHEETGVTVAFTRILGERVHPITGRTIVYVACEITHGDARVIDTDELVDLAWSTQSALHEYIPYGLFPVVRDYLRGTLNP